MKSIQITVTVPVVNRGNFDAIIEGLETAKRNLDLNDVLAVIQQGVERRHEFKERRYEFNGKRINGTVKLNLVESDG